ncbi:MAG: beta-lactamase family protein [Emcibacteraceae bacterium]|nr:beta-lactamase family protein [Emcibacteraceae bacterium]
MRLLSLIVLISFFQVSVASAVSVDDVIATFEKNFRIKLKENKVPGGAYAIIRGGKVIAMQGLGVRALGSKAPVDENTVFRLASVSKTFAAGLTAQLVEEHKFNWDD